MKYGLQLHQPRLWFITGGYLVKRWFITAAARARGQSNDLNREILASNLFNCHKEVINAPPVPSISRCIHIVYRHKNVWEYQWLNFIYNCMSTFLHYVHCKDALLDCSAPGGERCESLTWVDEIGCVACYVIGWCSYRLGKSWHAMHYGFMWMVGISTIFQRPLTVLLSSPNGRQMPAVRVVQGDCERVVCGCRERSSYSSKHVNIIHVHVPAYISCITYHDTWFMNMLHNQIIDTQMAYLNFDNELKCYLTNKKSLMPALKAINSQHNFI